MYYFIFLKVTGIVTDMRGKKFFLTISEFKNGKIIMNDTSNAYCGQQAFRIKTGDKTFNMHIDICDKMALGRHNIKFKMLFIESEK